jgi:hypothetical protein
MLLRAPIYFVRLCSGEEQEVQAHNGQSARERVTRRIEELRRKIRVRHGLPPEEE